MARLWRNKYELLVLTGAIYPFVAYLTAFTLEVLFLVELARQVRESNEQLLFAPNAPGQMGAPNSLESMRAHTTISCLAIAILYFVIFLSSLILIVALILRSTFMLLIWMCAMTTLYLPEFGLVVYVSLYGWGIETRNGQAEMGFYLVRAILNVVFIISTHKLFKQWKYEKNFFRLKSGPGALGALSTISALGPMSGHHAAATGRPFGAYDSPYFVGDSLTTTINPVFSSSSLNLSRYDHLLRRHQTQRDSPTNNSANGSSLFSSSDYVSDYNNTSSASHRQQHQVPTGGRNSNNNNKHQVRQQRVSSIYQQERGSPSSASQATTANERHLQEAAQGKSHKSSYSYEPTSRLYLSAGAAGGPEQPTRHQRSRPPSSAKDSLGTTGGVANRWLRHNSSTLSINDEFPDYEMDLDYRTLTSSRNRRAAPDGRSSGRLDENNYNAMIQPVHLDHSSHSTLSLDRRHLKDYGLPRDQVILRPLGHQPFEYLHRPGSTSNLSQLNDFRRN